MKLGALNTLLVHQRKPDDKGLGIKLEYKPTGAKLWCAVQQLSGNELAVAQQHEARANVLLTAQFVTDIRVGDRLAGEGRNFNIVAVHDVDNRHRELRLTCIEIVSP